MSRADLPVQSHPFVGGVATNVDARALRPPNLALLENCVFLPRGSLSKRPGCTDATTNFSGQDASGNWTTFAVDSFRSMFASRAELVAVDSDGVPLTWSPATNRWWSQASQGNLLAPRIAVKPAVKDGTVHTSYDTCQANGWRLTVWQPVSNAAGGLKYCVQDATTGALVIPPTGLGNGNSRYPAALAVGNGLLAAYVDTTANQLRVLAISVTATPAAGGGTDRLISANIRGPYAYDSDTNADSSGASTFGVFSYSAATTIESCTVDSTGTLTSGLQAEGATGGTIETVGVAVDPIVNNIGIAWVRNNAGTRSLRAAIRTSALASVAAETVVHSAYSTRAPGAQTTCVFQSAATGGNRVLHILYQDGAAGIPTTTPWLIRHATFNSAAAVGGPNVYAFNAVLASRAFRDRVTMMVNLFPAGLLPGTGEGVLTQTKLVLCTLGGTGAPSSPTAYYKGKYIDPSSGAHLSPVAVYNESGLGAGNGATVLAHAQPLGSRKYLIAVGQTTKYMRAAPSWGTQDFFDVSAAHAVIDFSSPKLQAVAVNGVEYLSGGLLMQHDTAPAETGFVLYPESGMVVYTSSAGGGGLTPASSYSWIIRYEWLNSRNVSERSTFIPATAGTAGGANRMTLTIPTLPFTARHLQRPVSIAVYRTVANPGTNPTFYRVTNLDPGFIAGSNRYVANDPSVGTVTFVDDLSDATLVTRDQLDVTLNQLDPISVPHCTCAATDGNRLWVAGLDDPNLLWPSLLVSGFGNGVEFNESLQMRVDDYGGDIIALAALNDRLIVFKERAIYCVLGDGPDNTGANGSFQTPKLIQSDVGCIQPETVLVTPLGIVFMSSKGFCLLDQALNVKYIGGPVETYNTKAFTAAAVLPKHRQVRFLSSTSPSLMYDYEVDQWGIFTGGHFGQCGATYLDSQFVYGTAAGVARFEDATFSTTFKDGSSEYGMRIETAWLHGASLQALLRSGRLAVLGKYYSPHKLRLTVFYDYDDDSAFGGSPGTVIDHTPAGTNGVQQVRFDLPARHDVQSIKLRLEEISLVSPTLNASFSLVEMAVELADEGGIARLAAARSA